MLVVDKNFRVCQGPHRQLLAAEAVDDARDAAVVHEAGGRVDGGGEARLLHAPGLVLQQLGDGVRVGDELDDVAEEETPDISLSGERKEVFLTRVVTRSQRILELLLGRPPVQVVLQLVDSRVRVRGGGGVGPRPDRAAHTRGPAGRGSGGSGWSRRAAAARS